MRFGKKFKGVHLLYVKSPKSRLCILHPLSYLRQVAPSQRRYHLSEVLHNIRDLTSSHNFFVTLLARSSPVCSMMHGEESTIKSRNWITFFAFPTTLLSSSVIRRLCRVSSSASVSWIPEESQIFATRIQKDQQNRWRGCKSRDVDFFLALGLRFRIVLRQKNHRDRSSSIIKQKSWRRRLATKKERDAKAWELLAHCKIFKMLCESSNDLICKKDACEQGLHLLHCTFLR